MSIMLAPSFEPKSQRSRLFFICVPRSGSTSMLKCLSVIEGVEAWFEPFVIARIARKEYRMHTGKDLPTDWDERHAVEFEVAAQRVQNMNGLPLVEGKNFAFSEVKRNIGSSINPTIVVKDMASSFSGRTQYLPSPDSGFKYVFVIRDPYLTFSSYKRASLGSWIKLNRYPEKSVKDFDIFKDDPYYRCRGGCYKTLSTIWKHVRENLDPEPLLIDTEDFLSDPKPFLQKICEVGRIEYHDGLMEWDASPDIITSWKNPGGVVEMLRDSLGDFHQTAINSSCFMTRTARKARPARSSIGQDVLRAVDEGMSYYNEMYEHRFKP